jgi:hypothetical protein
VKPRYWLVVDDLEGAAEHRLDLRFQFAPMEVTLDPALWIQARRRKGRASSEPSPASRAAAVRGSRPYQGWVSPDMGSGSQRRW